MKISTKGRYATRMAAYLAGNDNKGFVSLKEISEHENISRKYLEQIVPMLTKSGILRTNRGNKGGYQLAVKASELTVGDILRATEGNLAPIACLEFPDNECSRKDQCSTLFVWEGLYKVITDYLDNITIQDIIERNNDVSGDCYSI